MEKSKIIDAIRRLAAARGGVAPGRVAFERETGIRLADWYPHCWLRWSEAVIEAGYPANRFQTAISDDTLCQRYIDLVREIRHLPVFGELRRKARGDKSFPSHGAFRRLGGKEKFLEALLSYCNRHPGHEDVAAIISARKPAPAEDNGSARKTPTGFVYLMRSGRHYKIGRTNSVGTRERQLAIKIPVPPTTIHSIETDDPAGVEAYWHRRFDGKRGAGEWFDLAAEDVRAFQRWRRIV